MGLGRKNTFAHELPDPFDSESELLGNPQTRMVGNEIQDLFAAGDYPTASSLSVTLMAAIVLLVFIYVRRSGTEELV